METYPIHHLINIFPSPIIVIENNSLRIENLCSQQEKIDFHKSTKRTRDLSQTRRKSKSHKGETQIPQNEKITTK